MKITFFIFVTLLANIPILLSASAESKTTHKLERGTEIDKLVKMFENFNKNALNHSPGEDKIIKAISATGSNAMAELEKAQASKQEDLITSALSKSEQAIKKYEVYRCHPGFIGYKFRLSLGYGSHLVKLQQSLCPPTDTDSSSEINKTTVLLMENASTEFLSRISKASRAADKSLLDLQISNFNKVLCVFVGNLIGSPAMGRKYQQILGLDSSLHKTMTDLNEALEMINKSDQDNSVGDDCHRMNEEERQKILKSFSNLSCDS